MSIVKDQNLAPAGRRKINWVRDFMPALGGIEARFEQEQPFAGLRVAVSVHLEAKTANLGYVLAKGGAEVRLTGSNPLSTQDDVAAGLADMGVEVIISGGMGGGAVEIFNERNVEVVLGAQGDARAAVERYLKGELESTGSICHEHQHADECHG